MSQPSEQTNRLWTFFIVWFGQLISLTGSGLTGFALGVWVYQRTGSATQFALISFFTILPGIILSPLAGSLVDRWNRRRVMLIGDVGAGCCTMVMAFLLYRNQLDVWHIYLGMGISSAFNALQWPAYMAAITLMVPKQHLGRANGLIQLGEGVAQIIAPMLAGVLVINFGLPAVLLMDCLSFWFAVITLLVIRIPDVPRSETGTAPQSSIYRDARFGLSYILSRRGLFGLLMFIMAANFVMGIVQVLLTPLVLTFASVDVVGRVLTAAGLGFLGGSILMSLWGGPRRRVYGVLGCSLIQGLVLFLGGLQPSAWLVAGAAAIIMFNEPLILGCSQTIWQSKVAPEIQGRVFATRRAFAWASGPVAFLIAGPLADRVFEPMLAPNGLLAGSVGTIIGIGPGRGIGLLYVVLGIAMVLATIVGYLYPPLRTVDVDLVPDDTIEHRAVAIGSPNTSADT